jgi:TonB family protein
MTNARRCTALFTLLFTFALPAFAGNEVQKQLQKTIGGKVLFLRAPYAGSELKFDGQGKPIAGSQAGRWFTDGAVLVEQVSINKATMELKGRRCLSFYTAQKLQVSPTREKVSITVPLDSLADLSAATARLGSIFFRGGEAMPLPRPPLPATDRIGDEKYEVCEPDEQCRGFRVRPRGSTECRPATEIAEPVVVDVLPDGQKIYLSSEALIRALPIRHPDPSYSEQGLRKHITGFIQATVTVDQHGKVVSVAIRKGLSHGLDEQAVATLAGWQFEPARLKSDNTPVACWMGIEFSFRLHP